MKSAVFAVATVATLFVSGAAMSAPILIINGSSTTSETGTTNSITTQLSNLHTAAGNTVTVVDGVPMSLAGFAQVWDIRFNSPITASNQSLYLSYLQGGGGMFVMGENSGFMARNNSVLSLISAAGGGSLAFTSPSSAQIVEFPFDGPNPVTTINFSFPGGVDSQGTGAWITAEVDLTDGTGVAWGIGSLSNATAGALTTIFDVNFMQTTASAAEQALTANLIRFIATQVTPPAVGVSEPGTLAVLGLGLAGLAVVRRRRAA